MSNNIREFIEKVESAELLYLAWKETNLTPSQMEEAWSVIKSVLLDAVLVSEIVIPKDATPLTEVLDRPQHVELQYQQPTGSLIKNNDWICSICGKDTSQVEYDYLIGFDHLHCILKKEMRGQELIVEAEPAKAEPAKAEPIKATKEITKKVKKEKIVENSSKGDKTFLELLARGEYQLPKD